MYPKFLPNMSKFLSILTCFYSCVLKFRRRKKKCSEFREVTGSRLLGELDERKGGKGEAGVGQGMNP